MSGTYVKKLKPGDPFRDWLVYMLKDRIQNKKCVVRVFQFSGSHMVRRYEFEGEGFSVMAKFFNRPMGLIKKYDPDKAMVNEYKKLKRIKHIIDISRPIAINRNFDCVLVTEYVSGRPLYWYFHHENHLYDSLTAVAHLLRKLHDNTKTYYDREREFRMLKKNLDHLGLDRSTRKRYKKLLDSWWDSPFLDFGYGCMIHHDATPANYLIHRGRSYAIDFELSVRHGNPVHDLGILSAELKNYFALKGNDQQAEPYIGHFLWNYSKNKKEFDQITRILPFYMSYGLLRIARGNMHHGHKDYLLKEAESCLLTIKRHSCN
ncbi:phosphotransferase [Methanohalophilus halophilus]|uniref:Aminoglycoside phosphotransferase family protein n=1 Tax=Methanohalophilus halophilus TaxID=2177 RepID=A0A1L3Q4B9_9EURY|nr:phosphotransferase [Methanohalophilus halophilus]APH39726.1 serine/threonine protein phosphatase [Methanohalophilus halophilus]RNI08936.1 aminoglycoside phosphotransferase family protein [Methanohalophilus halophilus]SDW37586.1 hypothetical protein SAMN04515625_0859 [Methanohalophilus halophilus]